MREYVEDLTGELRADAISDAMHVQNIRIDIFDLLDSTNLEARRQADRGMSAPALIVASAQSEGRGRLGRSFYSPAHAGLYMSLLLEASDNSADNVRLTTATAVAVAESIDELCGIATEIKWVNDIYLGGRKICGILCESFTSAIGKRYAVVGIGLNLRASDFPDDIREKASSLCLEEDMRADFAARITDTLLRFWNDISSPEIIGYYREHSAVLGKRIAFTECGTEYLGLAETIDEYGRLTVLVDGGDRRVLSSGEISLRKTDA